MTILIDPHLLIADAACRGGDDLFFWERVVAMGGSERTQIGHESFHWVVHELEILGYPEKRVKFGPSDFARECQIAIERILTRVSRGCEQPAVEKLVPDYLGSVGAELCLAIDATEHGPVLDGLLTDSNHWNPVSTTLAIGLLDVELLFSVEQQPRAFESAEVKSVFEGRRVHILGGSVSSSALADCYSQLGVDADSVLWLESEKSKPARDVDERWAGLLPARDVAICVTGRVGHSVWKQGDRAARKRGVEMLECATQGRIVHTLRDWAMLQARAKNP